MNWRNFVEHPNRQRFTVAHELGHYLANHLNEHNMLYRDTSSNFRLSNNDYKEIQANRIAAEILMPKSVIEHLVYGEKIFDTKQLASIMNVSQLAMAYRLKNLGMVNDYEWL